MLYRFLLFITLTIRQLDLYTGRFLEMESIHSLRLLVNQPMWVYKGKTLGKFKAGVQTGTPPFLLLHFQFLQLSLSLACVAFHRFFPISPPLRPRQSCSLQFLYFLRSRWFKYETSWGRIITSFNLEFKWPTSISFTHFICFNGTFLCRSPCYKKSQISVCVYYLGIWN